jgi:hypothetical protein
MPKITAMLGLSKIIQTVVLGCWLLGCYSTNDETHELGGETHFLRSCTQSDCGNGLSCLCGVCTRSCVEQTSCDDLGHFAMCMDTSDLISDTQCNPLSTARVCASRCRVDSDCTSFDSSLQCMAGSCQVPAATTAVEKPLVILLVDSSGSMERMGSCACTTPSCDECLPDCAAGDRNRWTVLLEALTGSFLDEKCETLERTEQNLGVGAYDSGYYLPYHRPNLEGGQRPDGLLDEYQRKLRFGIATYDNWDTCLGAAPLISTSDFSRSMSESQAGLWSFGSFDNATGVIRVRPDGTRVGSIRYPGTSTEFMMDTGIRAPDAESGGLLWTRRSDDPLAINAEIQHSLLNVRPYGGTPTSAALDDLTYYLSAYPAATAELGDPKNIHVVLIADGYPDDDYRSFGCDCTQNTDANAPGYCGAGENPADMKCPYPLVDAAAQGLHCGIGKADCSGPLVNELTVVAVDIDDSQVDQRLAAIASKGSEAREPLHRTDVAGLRETLNGIFEHFVN